MMPHNSDTVLVLPVSSEGREDACVAASAAFARYRAPALQGGATVHTRDVTMTIVVAAGVLFVALAGPALYGMVYTADDLGAFHLPLRDFYSRALANGDRFDWCGDLFGGFYLTGEGQVGTYHPLHWLVYRLLPFAWAWDSCRLASYHILLIGVWFWLRGRGLAAVLFGATAFTFCSFNLLHFVHVNAMAVIAHVPWLLYAMDRVDAAIGSRSRPASETGRWTEPFQIAARASVPFVLIASL